MATYTSNYAWTKPGGNDQVDISVLNGNLDSQDAIMHKAFTNMAQAFSAASTYAVGDIVLYDNVLYKCHTAVTVAGAWTGSTNWQVYKLSEGGSGGGGTSNYTDLSNKPQINGVTLSGNKTEDDLGLGYTTIAYEDWLELTPQEQETGKWDVTGVPGGGGGGSSQKAYGTAVNILTATQANPYTCPSDGVVNIQSGYASSNYTALYKIGWSGFMAIAKGNESQANGAMTVPVLKGDQLYVTTSGTNPVANYYPYVDA